MANVISDETMEYVGILAKLELKDEELDFLAAAGMSRREELQRKHEKGGH